MIRRQFLVSSLLSGVKQRLISIITNQLNQVQPVQYSTVQTCAVWLAHEDLNNTRNLLD